MTAAYNFGAASNFIVNITELQNTITSASGTSGLTTLSNAVARLQEMVIYDEKRIAVNTISRFNQTPIQVVDSLNLASNAVITSGGEAITVTTSTTFETLGTVGNVSSFTYYMNTVSSAAAAISFQVGSPAQTPFQILGNGTTVIGGGLKISGAGTPGIGKYLTCMDLAGTAEWQTPAIPSDARFKEGIRPLEDWGAILEGIHGVRFRWKEGGVEDVGVIAQDVLSVLPEAVEGSQPMMVYYYKLVPVLIEAIKSLEQRVEELETRCADMSASKEQ